jgi:chemotaxis response regulator CheB
MGSDRTSHDAEATVFGGIAEDRVHDEAQEIRHFPIVGIGASAGGLEAFTQLLICRSRPAWRSCLSSILTRPTRAN